MKSLRLGVLPVVVSVDSAAFMGLISVFDELHGVVDSYLKILRENKATSAKQLDEDSLASSDHDSDLSDLAFVPNSADKNLTAAAAENQSSDIILKRPSVASAVMPLLRQAGLRT